MSTIPKEAEPDVRIPIIYVQLTQRGISPEDSERLLLRPVETQLKSVGNVKEMRSTAYRGRRLCAARIRGRLRFQVGARRRARQGRPGQARPAAATPTSRACRRSTSRSIRCWWWRCPATCRSARMLRIARTAKNAIEQVPGVLSAELRGARDEAVEIIAEPMLMKSYGVSLDQLIAGVQRLQQPDRRRRAGRRDRPLRRQGAGPDREAAGRAEDSGRRPPPARR